MHRSPFSRGTGRRSSCVDSHTLCPGCWPIGHWTWFFIIFGDFFIWIFRGLSTAEISGRWYLFLMMMALRGLNSMEVHGGPSSMSTKKAAQSGDDRVWLRPTSKEVSTWSFSCSRERESSIFGYNLKQHGAMGHSAEFLAFESACLQSLPSRDRVYSICHCWARFQPVAPSLAPVMVLQLALIPNLSIGRVIWITPAN